MTQVLHGEPGRQLLVRPRAQAVHDLEELADVVYPGGWEDHVPKPGHEAVTGEHGDEHEPEPHEDVDLLVEEVDGQDALHAVVVLVAHLPDVEVTHSHPREPLGGRPVLAHDQVFDHLEPVQVVVRGQEGVQHEQLADSVGDVEDLHGQVGGHQVVPVPPAAQQRQLRRQDVT